MDVLVSIGAHGPLSVIVGVDEENVRSAGRGCVDGGLGGGDFRPAEAENRQKERGGDVERVSTISR